MTELHVPDINAMAEGRKVAEMDMELRNLKRKAFILQSALRAATEENELTRNHMLLWRCISALECIVILSLLAIHFFS